MNVKLRIEDKLSMIELVSKLKKAGLLKEEISLNGTDYPMDIPLDVDKLLSLTTNPIVGKVFGRKMETTLTANLKRALKV